MIIMRVMIQDCGAGEEAAMMDKRKRDGGVKGLREDEGKLARLDLPRNFYNELKMAGERQADELMLIFIAE